MADEGTAPSGAPPGAGGATNVPETPRLLIEAQYVKDLSFEQPNAPASLSPSEKRPDIKVGVEARARPVKEGSYELELVIKAEARHGDEVLFLVDLTYGGVMTVQNVRSEMLQPVLLIEGPRLLFPFARRIIADVTRDGGFPPLMLSPIDFVELYRKNAAARARPEGRPASPIGPDGKPLIST
jgi:preprotein translocase subunit SecB